MAFYLAAASAANLVFLVRSVLDNLSKNRTGSASDKRFLLFLGLNELAWVVPCFVQCFIIFLEGNDGGWSPKKEESGCDVQGFYSVFSATNGQLMGLLAGYLTLQAVRREDARDGDSGNTITFGCIALAVVSLLIAALPFMGAGEFKYSGEGFCYFDWYDKTHMAITFIVSTISIVGGIVMFLMAFMEARMASRLFLLLFPLAFFAGWFLWPIASMYGLNDTTIPDHMLITGAILGHMQALINPVIYGIIWRDMFVGIDETQSIDTKLFEKDAALYTDPKANVSAKTTEPEMSGIVSRPDIESQESVNKSTPPGTPEYTC